MLSVVDAFSQPPAPHHHNKPWKGGFIQQNPECDIPRTKPDLSSLGPLQGNLDNIHKLDRMQKVHWPEFSWLNDMGKPASRLFRKFYDNISRIGYTQEGQVYSIICPQMGTAPLPGFGTFNVEVHVTGTRGWVDEDTNTICAELGVEGHVWLSMNKQEMLKHPLLYTMEKLMNSKDLPFSKENAIVVPTYVPFQPYNRVLSVTNGTTTDFPIPMFAQHWEGETVIDKDGKEKHYPCFGVANIVCEVDHIPKTGNALVDDFNQLLMDLFNIASGKMLTAGNVISWNLWMTDPDVVDREEWAKHAEVYRRSIDVDHEHLMPIGGLKDFNGNDVYFSVVSGNVKDAIKDLVFKFISKHQRKILPSRSKLFKTSTVDDEESDTEGDDDVGDNEYDMLAELLADFEALVEEDAMKMIQGS